MFGSSKTSNFRAQSFLLVYFIINRIYTKRLILEMTEPRKFDKKKVETSDTAQLNPRQFCKKSEDKVAAMEAQVKQLVLYSRKLKNNSSKNLSETEPRQFERHEEVRASETGQEPRQFGKKSENKIAAMEAQVKQWVLNSRKKLK